MQFAIIILNNFHLVVHLVIKIKYKQVEGLDIYLTNLKSIYVQINILKNMQNKINILKYKLFCVLYYKFLSNLAIF